MTGRRDEHVPYDERGWRVAGFTSEQVAHARRIGLPLRDVQGWRQAGPVDAETCLAWWEAMRGTYDHPVTDAMYVERWIGAGVLHPLDRPNDCGVEVFILCGIAGIPTSPRWDTDRHCLCPRLMRVAHEQGQDPAVAQVLIDALITVKDWQDVDGQFCQHRLHRETPETCDWNLAASLTARDYLRLLAGLDWAQVLTCMQAGLSPVEAHNHVRFGGDMDMVATLGALRS